MSFLPENYKAPKSSNNYMKIIEGENKIRILSQPILGWEDWLDKKPIRYRMEEKPAKSIDPKKPIKHFWAMIVWNYAEEQIQILQISQATIRSSLENLCKDTEWGLPYFYDLKIFKKGEGKDTEYVVNPVPPKQLNPEVIAYFNEKRCNLDALFSGEDPFSQEHKTFTYGVFNQNDITPVKAEDVESYLSLQGEDKEMMRKFLDKVCVGRKWTPEEAVREFKKDPEATNKKFNDWKKSYKLAA